MDNTLAALKSLLATKPARDLALRYRRAEVVLSSWRRAPRPELSVGTADVLDADLRSDKSRALAEDQRSSISRAWGVVSAIQPNDFARAIGAANETLELLSPVRAQLKISHAFSVAHAVRAVRLPREPDRAVVRLELDAGPLRVLRALHAGYARIARLGAGGMIAACV